MQKKNIFDKAGECPLNITCTLIFKYRTETPNCKTFERKLFKKNLANQPVICIVILKGKWPHFVCGKINIILKEQMQQADKGS